MDDTSPASDASMGAGSLANSWRICRSRSWAARWFPLFL
jgi:hypothetical protein